MGVERSDRRVNGRIRAIGYYLQTFITSSSDFGLIDTINASFPTESSIAPKQIVVGDTPNTAICLPWRTSHQLAYEMGLVPRSTSYIAYTMPPEIVSPDPSVSLAVMKSIAEDVVKHRTSIDHLIAYSVGQFPGVAAANLMDIDRLTIAAPGTRLGICLWTGTATQHVRKKAVLNGYTHESYDAIIDQANPIHNTDSLPPKVDLHIGGYDRYIRPRFGLRFAQVIERRGYDVESTLHRSSGHLYTVMKAAYSLFN